MPNSIVHWELQVSDLARARAFYGKIFDWQFDDQAFPGYTTIRPGDGPAGGMLVKPAAAPGAALNVYFRVDAIDRTLRDVVEAGGTVVVPKTEVPGICWFAMFLDPDRVPVGILEEKPKV